MAGAMVTLTAVAGMDGTALIKPLYIIKIRRFIMAQTVRQILRPTETIITTITMVHRSEDYFQTTTTATGYLQQTITQQELLTAHLLIMQVATAEDITAAVAVRVHRVRQGRHNNSFHFKKS